LRSGRSSGRFLWRQRHLDGYYWTNLRAALVVAVHVDQSNFVLVHINFAVILLLLLGELFQNGGVT
jgi:hypothetical protein